MTRPGGITVAQLCDLRVTKVKFTSSVTPHIAAKVLQAVSYIFVLVEVRQSCVTRANDCDTHYNLQKQHKQSFSHV